MEKAGDISSKLKSKYAIAIYCLFTIIYIAKVSPGPCDFYIYLSASKDLFQGKDIFAVNYMGCFHYYYSVLFAILIYPFNYLPLLLAQYIWLYFNAFLMWQIIKILGGYFKLSLLPVKEQWVFFILCCAFSAKFVLANLYVHQITILILYLIVQGLEYIFSGKEILGAILIAIGINIKILPILLLPYLIYRRKFIASGLIVIIYALMLLLPAMVIGFHQNNILLSSWWQLVNPMNKEHLMDIDQKGFHSLTSFLANLLTYTPPDKQGLQMRHNIANLSLTQLTYVINAVRLVLVAFSLYFLRTRPFYTVITKSHRYWEISYILLITPLIFPHQQHYSFILAVPCMWHILYYVLKDHKNMSKFRFGLISTALTISFLTINATFLLGEFNPFYESFKILTYGVLLLVPLLAVTVPDTRVTQ
jgi:hypothetical protein